MNQPTITHNRAIRKQWLTDRDQLVMIEEEYPTAARTIHHNAQRTARHLIETNRRARRLLGDSAEPSDRQGTGA